MAEISRDLEKSSNLIKRGLCNSDEKRFNKNMSSSKQLPEISTGFSTTTITLR